MRGIWAWFKELILAVRLRYAKRIVGIDLSGPGRDIIYWTEIRKVGDVLYVTGQGCGYPPARVRKNSTIYKDI